MDRNELIAFEKEVADAFGAGKIRGPIHLAGGNEDELIEIFKGVGKDDWVFSTWRSHFHALLHGVPRGAVMAEIMAGRSMNLYFPEHRFLTSAIVGGCLPIAVGVAAGIKREGGANHVWCFVGDMAASIGLFNDAVRMSHGLPITFVIENNGLSVNSPTVECWPNGGAPEVMAYKHARTYPHSGIDRFVQF